MDVHQGSEIQSSEASDDNISWCEESLSWCSTAASEDNVSWCSTPASPVKMACPSIQTTAGLSNIVEYFQLSQSISHGDLQGVKDFLNQRPDAITAWIDVNETPLLKACHYGQLEIVKELLQRMRPEQMVIPAEGDPRPPFVPLTIAAGNGNFEIVKALFEKNPLQLVPTRPGRFGVPIPVVTASLAGHKEITRYLFERTPLRVLMDDDGYWATWLLLDTIFYGMFDIAINIFYQKPSIAVAKLPNLVSPFVYLASKSDLFIRGSNLGFWGRMVYSYLELPADLETTSLNSIFGMFLQCLPKWFGIQRIHELKERDDKAHEFLSEVCKYMSLMVKDNDWSNRVYYAVFEAVKSGNKQFFIEMVKRTPHVILLSYQGSRSNMFHWAVQYRKEKIFNLVYGLNERKIALFQGVDINQNNILHTAAHLPNKEELSKAAGAALKMQRELHWYKEVESLMQKRKIYDLNKQGMTPRQVFETSHEPLRKEAEEWMKYTATASSLVAALIATITFQAIFTVPGGNDDKLGDPIYLNDIRFTLFIISNTISFFASCTSVLIFLSILTARYSFDDFLVSLPRKMILGLTILFVSIAAMLVAFSSALFVSLRQKPLLVIPVMPLALLPAVLFLTLQYPLLKEMISSTYGKGIFDRDTKPWC